MNQVFALRHVLRMACLAVAMSAMSIFPAAAAAQAGIERVQIVSSVSARVGSSIAFAATITENVTVDISGGSPTLTFVLGQSTKSANYVDSGNPTQTLLFVYHVQVGDEDTDGLAFGNISLNGSTIRSAGGGDLSLAPNDFGNRPT